MAGEGVKLFVGAKVRLGNGSEDVVYGHDCLLPQSPWMLKQHGSGYRDGGRWGHGECELDIVEVLNPEDDPDNKRQPVKLFVGAKCERRNGCVVTIEKRNDSYRLSGIAYPFQASDGQYYTEGGRFMVGLEHPFDIIRVLNTEDHPDRQSIAVNGSGNPVAGVGVVLWVNDSIDRTVPPGIPKVLRDGWERSAYGFSLTNEEVRRLWSMVGFPLPAPRKRCNDCNCTGRVERPNPNLDAIPQGWVGPVVILDCETCQGRGYLPVGA